MSLKNKNIIITGASRGIGKAIALAFSKAGARVIITYKDKAKEASDVVNSIKESGHNAYAIQLDINDRDSRNHLVNKAISLFKRIDVLINNAGIIIREKFLEMSEQSFDEVMNVNLKGQIFLTQSICKHMIQQGTNGSIVNISSSRDATIMSNILSYSCSKAGLTIFSKALSAEMSSYGIRVNTVAPGLIKTDMHRTSWESNPEQWDERIKHIPIGRSGKCEDIASMVLFLANNELSGYITGSRFVIDGGRNLSL